VPARPAAAPARPATTTAVPASAVRPANARPAAAPAKPAAAASKAAPARAEPSRRAAEREPKPERPHRAAAAPPPDKTMMFGWIAAIGITVIAGAVFFNVQMTKSKEKAAEDAHLAEVKDAVTQIKAFDISVPEQATKMLALADQKAELWKGSAEEMDVVGLIAQARRVLDTEKDRAEIRDQYANVQKQLENIGKLSSEEIGALRRHLQELSIKSELMGPDFSKQLDAASNTAKHAYADMLLTEAKTAAAGGPEAERASLPKYAKAEDELLAMLEDAHNKKDAEEKWYEERYKRCIAESDAISKELFTPEAIKKAPVRDLLTPDSKWNPSKDLPSFSFALDRGVAHMANAADAKNDGIVSIGDLDNWRDFALDMDFTLVKGKAEVYLRLGRRADSRVYSIVLDTEGPHALVAGQQYHCELTFIGSTAWVNIKAEGISPATDEVFWGKSRKGAIGFVIPSGTELNVSSMRIRVLR
jgi:hypothetical protein